MIKEQIERQTARKARRQRKTETSTKVIDMTDNEVFNLLEDENLTSEEKENKLVELLNLSEFTAEAVQENKELNTKLKNVIKQVLDQFSEHNKRSIELTRDNPLSKLSSGIQEVFENYHEMNEGRADLKGTLKTVDEMLRDMGGEDKLVSAMLEAKDRSKEILKLTESVKIASEAATKSKNKGNRATTRIYEEKRKLSGLEDGFFSFLKSVEISASKKELQKLEDEYDEILETLSKDNSELKEVADKLSKLQNSKDFAVHKQILAILDIGDDTFKQKLANLAGVTLQYIDDTKMILTNVRDQLELLLTEVDTSLDVNVNIRERMTILSSALVKSNNNSIDALKVFKAEAEEEESSLVRLENEKVTRIADDYISELGDTMTSTGMINAEVQKIEVVIMSLRDQLKNGLLDANEQLLISVNNATASGMVMMNKAQTLGTLAQSVIAKGQYLKESEETYGDLAEQFRNQLAVRAGRNDTLDSMTDVLHTISESLEDTNMDNADLIADQRDLVLDLNDSVDRLKEAAETARSLQSSAKVGDYQ